MSHLQILPAIAERVDPLVERFLDMRNKFQWMMGVGGERVLLYQRREQGTLCPFYDPIRRQHRQDIDEVCFGTNFVGEYYPPVEIFVSINQPGSQQKIRLYEEGIRREFVPTCWALWEPIMKNRDFIVRRDGSRLWITDVTTSRWRHHVLRSLFKTEEIEHSSQIYKIPLPGIFPGISSGGSY